MRVIGALIIREMHTRFGRRRFGYLWLFFEPLLLGSMIAVIHQTRSGGEGIRGNFEFFSIGYILFFNFRGIMNRASGTISSNLGLLYHRQVTLPDLFYARHIIESVACLAYLRKRAFAFLILTACSIGLPPCYPGSQNHPFSTATSGQETKPFLGMEHPSFSILPAIMAMPPVTSP